MICRYFSHSSQSVSTVFVFCLAIKLNILIFRKWPILYLHKSHNTPLNPPSPPPPHILHNHCLQFLLGHEDVLREIENNAYSIFLGEKRCLGICPSREFKLLNEGVVSKETVVLRRWGSSIQKFGFINGVDNVNWPPYRDSKS